MKAIIVADDITGALDSAAAFASRGLRTVCALTADHVSEALDADAEVVAVSTNSREVSVEDAVRLVGRVADCVAEHAVARHAIRFKKIDSRLKGHVAAEVACLRRGREPVTLCPAVPALGRYSCNGMLMGAGVMAPLPIAGTAGLPEAEVIDAESQPVLDAKIQTLDLERIFVGAAGLAAGLAARLKPEVCSAPQISLPAPALFAIGSRDPVTIAQLDLLAGRGMPSRHAPDGTRPDGPAVSDHLDIIRMTMGRARLDPHAAATRFAAMIAERIRSSCPALLLACGGETGGAILGHLGCGLLDVLGETLPGIPVSRPRDGGAGMLVLTKSGGFGGEDTLAKLVGKLVKSTPILETGSQL